nr:DUF2199 domain-containing protein [Mesobacillus campisalis]
MHGCKAQQKEGRRNLITGLLLKILFRPYGEGPFIWDVLVSLSEANFNKTIENWDIEGREEELEPMFGWLSTSIPCYPETINLKTMVHTRPLGVTPYIELEPTEHPLALEQSNGIPMERIKQLAEELCEQDEQD